MENAKKLAPSSSNRGKNNYRNDLTQFLQRRISDYEKKQEEARQQLSEIQHEYQNLFGSI